jgi:hypothetical protein
MKIAIPDSLAEKMAVFPAIDFQEMAVGAIKQYVSDNEPPA